MGVMDDAGDTGAVSRLYNDLIKKVEIKQAKKGVKINKTADTADDIGDAGRRAGVEGRRGAEIKEVIPPGSSHPVEVYTDGIAQINKGKVDTYMRGKVELDVDLTQSRIKEIENIKKTARTVY